MKLHRTITKGDKALFVCNTMIGGETIDNVQIFPKCLLILGTSQPWPDFALAAEGGHIIGSQKQVVRTDLAGNR